MILLRILIIIAKRTEKMKGTGKNKNVESRKQKEKRMNTVKRNDFQCSPQQG